MRKSAVFLTIFLGLLLAWIIPNYTPTHGDIDFVRYWAASRLLVEGGNPYQPDELRQAVWKEKPDFQFDLVWNPPWLLLLLAPLSLLPLKVAVSLWIFICLVLIALALHLAWQLIPGDKRPELFTLILGVAFLFGSTIINLRIGQISPLILISLAFFAWAIHREHDILAGMVLLLAFVKPHVVYLALLYIGLWILFAHRWKILVGMATAGIVSMGITWLLIPSWLSDYIRTVFSLPYSAFYTSTLDSFMSSVFGVAYFRYIGLLLIPFIGFLAYRARPANWFTYLNISLLASMATTPYGFSFDQVVLLLPISEMLLWISQDKLTRRLKWIVGIGLVVVFSYEYYLMSIPFLPYFWFVWISVAILGLYLFAYKFQGFKESQGM